jgi:hypothetical protein
VRRVILKLDLETMHKMRRQCLGPLLAGTECLVCYICVISGLLQRLLHKQLYALHMDRIVVY